MIILTAQFDLVVTTDNVRQIAEFSLRDAHGTQLAYHAANIQDISVSDQRGLFDLRNFLRLYVEPGKEAAAMAKIGVLIAEKLLGPDIFTPLWQPTNPRTLRIQLPGPDEGIFAGALARVPWEIARPAATEQSLGERNLRLRVVHDMAAPPTQPLQLESEEPLRVLFVFAEARGSRPLGARQERRQLLQLFNHEIYPKRRVVAHFLTHGVTRERLADQIERHGGYHIVHWSGHGHLNLLELAKPGGARDHLSGKELLDLFNQAGGFLPRLLFLSACHSGDILRVQDWDDFLAAARGLEPRARGAEVKEMDAREIDLKTEPGFTGTAHALLQGGVPTVVAMRYAVGDDYARELAVAFYRSLLADHQPKSAAAALALARKIKAKEHEASRFAACDHATPLLYGAEQPGLTLEPGRSPEAHPRDRRLQHIAELTIANHQYFVGRTWELAGLGADFIGASRGAEVKPMAVITGLGGMGKTALVAEALELWATNFDRVLLYQAKPNALGFEATLRDIDTKLRGELGRYHDHIKQHPADAIYRDAGVDFTGPDRLTRLTRNLLRALQDEALLLVLDNFESNLKPQPEPGTGEPRWACQDLAWDACLKLLAHELPGSPSRVLLTSRRPLADLADGAGYAFVLGPLPPGEAALYLRAHPALNRMMFGADAAEKQLAQRLFTASRFHPLLLDRLARLAANPGLRGQLLAALDTLEKTKDFTQLPALFATTPGDSKELAYLDDALAASLDQLIGNASPDTRRLLWIIALANDPVALGLLKRVWGGDNPQYAQLREIKQLLDKPPPEMQAELQEINTPELHARLETLPSMPARPEIEPLLRHLVSVGLISEERATPEDENPNFTCHELVRERIRAWMVQSPADRGELSENAIRLAYAAWLEAYYDAMQHRNMSAALEGGSQALVYCVQAKAWEKLGGFASDLITGTSDPRLLAALLPHLQIAAEAAPEGRLQWSCLSYLADALAKGGRPDASMPFYEQAAALARAAAETGGGGARQAWSDLGAISGNWAHALRHTGKLDAARQRLQESADAKKHARRAAVNVIASELEALRIDILQGGHEAALPQVEARLAQVRQWWERHRAGQPVPEAPDAKMLARIFIGALDIAEAADLARKDWLSALGRLDTTLEVEHALQMPVEDIGATRFNRANVLLRLPGRLDEARAELEDCLGLFKNNPGWRAKVLSSLANLLKEQNDLPQAVILERRALALREVLPAPYDRAVSHNNLANYLERLDPAGTLAETNRHRLAALLYFLVAGLRQHAQTSLGNYTVAFRRAQAAGTATAVPRLAELLADPAFASLDQWLRQQSVDVAELQAIVDQQLEQVRQAAAQNQ